jgi:hypothetical protein
MAYVVGMNGLYNGIIDDSTGALLRAGYTDLTEFLQIGQSCREDVPIPAKVYGDPTNSSYFRWDGTDWVEEENSVMISINNNWTTAYADYKSARVAMYAAMVTKATQVGGWSNLSLLEKQLSSSWFIVGVNERNTVHTLQQQIANGRLFKEYATVARKRRLDEAMSQVYNRVSYDDVNTIIYEMDSAKLMYNYVVLGIEGTLEGDIEGLIDYILSRVGTSFENIGLTTKNFTVEGMSGTAEFATLLVDIIKNGNY